MFTKIKTESGTELHTTQQYAMGTYLIIDNDPNFQCMLTCDEIAYHIKLRQKVLKDKKGASIINGIIIESYRGKYSINSFTQ